MNEAITEILNRHGYGAATGTFLTGRPDRATVPLTHPSGRPVVAKFYPAGGGELVYKNMLALWNSSFGKNRKPPGLPHPIDFLPEENILIMERLQGSPLAELDPQNRSLMKKSIALLADLHDSNTGAKVERSSKKIIRSIKRKAHTVQQIAPRFSEAYNQAIQDLESGMVKDIELVSSHGDFSPRNVLVCGDRFVLIDWDRFQQADPARDVAYYGVWCWASYLRNGHKPEWSAFHECASLYDRLCPAALVRERLSFHVAAGLLRVAHSIVKLWPEQIQYVPELIAEARDHIQQRQGK